MSKTCEKQFKRFLDVGMNRVWTNWHFCQKCSNWRIFQRKLKSSKIESNCLCWSNSSALQPHILKHLWCGKSILLGWWDKRRWNKGTCVGHFDTKSCLVRKMRIGAGKSRMTFCGENRKLHFVQSVKCAQNMQIFQRKNKCLFLMKQVVTQVSATVSCLLNRNLHGNWCIMCDWFGNVEWIGQFETRTPEAKMCVRKNIFGHFSSFWSMFSIKMAL